MSTSTIPLAHGAANEEWSQPYHGTVAMLALIVAETAAQEWSEDALFTLYRGAWPYRTLKRADFDTLVTMLAQGVNTSRGRRGALLHHDAINHVLRGRRGASGR